MFGLIKNIVVTFRKKIQLIISCEIPFRYLRTVEYPHPIGIVIGSGTIIHENVVIYQNVTIGRSKINSENGYPIIENDVIIYAGAVIVGNVRIGTGSIIGANSVVTKSVAPNLVVFGYNKTKCKNM